MACAGEENGLGSAFLLGALWLGAADMREERGGGPRPRDIVGAALLFDITGRGAAPPPNPREERLVDDKPEREDDVDEREGSEALERVANPPATFLRGAKP